MPPKPIPPELLALRRHNVMALFLRWRLHEIAQGLPGEDRAFAARLGITGAQWSRVKSGTPVGSKLARQFEQACEVDPGWLDQAHDQPGAPAAWPDIPGSEQASPAALASALGLSAQAGPDGPTTLLVRADDDSMRDLGILDGNLLLVDLALVAEPGDIVLVRLDDEYRIRQLCLQDGQLRLLAANPAFAAIVPPEGQPWPIWGVVTSVIRRLR
ncbi:MAG: hypothetical protein A2486_15325 [Burkholderiales bacterium RIFOXYC12_FULL_65_23]|uniref:LexA family protein n=1 Tax=Malikia spinosa TaxID=86180 RepID=UPI0008B5A670|nr:MAG: hypothetical protein A2486_15325 [Burkholderiales bacterium RIFOXYC12_FULL_65_23]